jgi:AcrR family transcriptional regulator
MPRVLSDAEIAGFRTRLCQAAEQLFAEQGIEAVTMRQLAVALGVSPMTPYRYFRDKDEIIDAVRTSAYNTILAQAKSGMKFKDPKNDTWRLVPDDDIATAGSQMENLAGQARTLLTRVVDEHPGTPWAHLAAPARRHHHSLPLLLHAG